MKKRYLLLPLAIALASIGSSHAQGSLPCTNPINTFPYNQNFDSGNGGWTSGILSGTANSWAHGSPSKPVITAAYSGPNCWITGLTANYENDEDSYVVSPCFDFTSLGAPIVEMKVFWNSESGYDGAVLQSSTDGGQTWQTVGAVGDPNNWYNDPDLNGNPGGQLQGWGGRNGTGSGGWVTAKHALPSSVARQPNVRLRIAFGSDISVTDDGFAFDNFQIYDPAPNDVGMVAILTPVTGSSCSAGPSTVKVQLQNYGSQTQSNIPVSYSINGGAPVTGVVPGPLAPNADTTYTFTTPFTPSGNGTYVFTATTNLSGDGNTTNDAVTGTTLTVISAVTSFPYTQDFESGAGGWVSGILTGTANSWALGTPNKSTINGASSGANAWVTGLTTPYANSESSYVLSPCFDFSSLALPGIEMKVWWNSEFSYDGAVLQSSIDGGATWQNVGGFGDPNNWYNDASINGNPGGQQEGWTGTTATNNGSGGWVLVKHSLPALARKPSVRFRIAFGSEGSGNDDGFAFDDVSVVALTPPPPPQANDLSVLAFIQPQSSCTLGNAERVSVLLLNLGTRAQSNVPVTVKYTTPSGTVRVLNTMVTGPILPGASNAQPVLFPSLQNLSATGCYEFKAYATLATDTVTSNDTARTRICKLLVNSFPYNENFDGAADGWGASGGTWALGTPNKSVIRGAASGNNVWVTGGLGGRYDVTENSSVESPCFDMTRLSNPVVQLKVWYQTEPGRDGASLQYSIDNGATWTTLGSSADPSWYNASTIAANPGGSGEGWSGASGGYVLMRHDLAGTPVVGNSQARFRVVFSAVTANPAPGNDTDDGIAFDDFAIYEKPNNDIAVVSMQQVGSACGYGVEPVVVKVKNLGIQPASNFTVSYAHNGAAPVSTTVTQVLQPNAETDVTINPPVDLSAPITHTLVITANLPNDQIALNNTLTVGLNSNVANIAPIGPIDFEASWNTINRLTIQTQARSNVFTLAGQGTSGGTALVMTGGGSPWVDPLIPNTAWSLNPDNFASATLCVNPSNMNTNRPFYLFFDLKQVATGTGTLITNTNFRVVINGTQVGPTYRPTTTTNNYQSIVIPLAQFRNGNQTIQIQFQSSTKRSFSANSGDATFLDNIRVDVATGLEDETAFGRGVLVFPNPSTGVFQVVFEHEGSNTYGLTVTDLSGRVIRKQQVSATGRTQAEVDLTSLSRGIYLLRVTDAKGNQSVRKLSLE